MHVLNMSSVNGYVNSKLAVGEVPVKDLQAKFLITSKVFNTLSLHRMLLTDFSFSLYVKFLDENSTLSTDVFKKLFALREKESSLAVESLISFQYNSSWSFEKFMVVLAAKQPSALVVSCVPYWFLTESEAARLFDFFTSRKKNGVLTKKDFSLFSRVVAALVQNKALPTSFIVKALEFAPYVSNGVKDFEFYIDLLKLVNHKGVEEETLVKFFAELEESGFSFPNYAYALHLLASSSKDFKKIALSLKDRVLHVAAASSLFLKTADVEFLISLGDVTVLDALLKNPVVSLADLKKVKKALLERHSATDLASQAEVLINLYDSSFLLRLGRRKISGADVFAVIDTLRQYAKEGVSLSPEEKFFISRVKDRVYSTLTSFKNKQTADSVCLNFIKLQANAKLLGFSSSVIKDKFSVDGSTSTHFPAYNHNFDYSTNYVAVIEHLLKFCALDVRKWELVLSLLDDSSLPLYEFCDMITSLL